MMKIFKPDEINNISTIYIYIYFNIIIPIINLYIMSSSRSIARTHKSGSETAREPIVSNRLWNSTGNLPKQKYPQTNDVGSSTKHFKSMQRQLRKREKLLKQMARVEKSMKHQDRAVSKAIWLRFPFGWASLTSPKTHIWTFHRRMRSLPLVKCRHLDFLSLGL